MPWIIVGKNSTIAYWAPGLEFLVSLPSIAETKRRIICRYTKIHCLIERYLLYQLFAFSDIFCGCAGDRTRHCQTVT